MAHTSSLIYTPEQVEVTHLGPKKRKYRVTGIEKPANALTFPNEQENRDMTVADYFEKQYNLRCARAS